MDASLFRIAGYPVVPHPFATPDDGLRLWGLTLFMTSDLVDMMWTRQPPRPLRGPLPVLDWWDVRLALRLWQRWTDRPVAGQVQSRSGPTAAYFLILRLAVAAAVLGRVTLGGLLVSRYLSRGSRAA
ncbi:hypothetical protein IWQ60_008171 [Tieghemiomyces parasiticus]|uniref:Uncharacterized protein n=1 Tax=Tieghemiomyces parasiticus TaxID=78921 RepID=A0A9W7ZZZ3_9FUNG|nr:hypothetical protein IWQ60_008171 [Tieghemiomyces parasiticus]